MLFRSPPNILIQTLEPAPLLLQQLMRLAVLDQRALLHDDDLVEVQNRVEFVRDGDDGVGCEFLAQEALDLGVGLGVEAVSYGLVMRGEGGWRRLTSM